MIKEKLQSAKQLLIDIKNEWKVPRKGNYVPYKEILSLGLGGMGQQWLISFVGLMSLTASNTLLGATLGLKPMDLQYMAMVQTILGLFFTVIRGVIVDNTKTRFGKFRPYIAIMGFPVFILITIFLFLPFETMGYTQKLICTFVFAVTLGMISPLLTDTYSELATVITPNSEERAKVMSINSLLYSFAPTIGNIVIPLMADHFGGYTNINTYRYVFMPMAAIGLALNLFAAVGCKERIITSKNYKPKINVLEGCVEIWKNKHWWLRNIAGYIGFLEGASGVLFGWIYIYGTQDMVSYAALQTVLGTASGIAMLATPLLMKTLGNRRLLIFHNALNIVFVSCMAFSYKVPILLFVFIYMNTFVNALTLVYNSAMHSEVKDYQQYLSGKRMDFMFGTAGLIGTPITMLTGLVIPYVYECLGITTNYDILYDPAVRNNIFYVLCILSIVGATLNLIPYMFYSLSREKHRNIIRVLYYRSLCDDYRDGNLTAESVSVAVENIRQGIAYIDADAPDMNALKADLKKAKAMPKGKERDEAVRKAKKTIKDAKQLLVEKDAAKILTDEFEKYDTYQYRVLAKQAEMLLETPIEQIAGADIARIAAYADALSEETKEEKKTKKLAKKNAKKMQKMTRLAAKDYPNGVVRPLQQTLNNALDMPQETKEEKKAKETAIHKIEKEMALFNKVCKPYVAAEELSHRSTNSKAAFAEAQRLYDEALMQQAETEGV